MRNKLALLLASCFLVSGIWLQGNGQTGTPTAVAEAQAALDKCWQELHDAEIRAHNLRMLVNEYYWDRSASTLSKDEKERVDRWREELIDLEWGDKYGNSGLKWVCLRVASAEKWLNREIEASKKPPTPTPTPSPTPDPYTGPPIIADDPNFPNFTEEEVNKFLENVKKIGPLSTEIFDWVKKQKAKLPPAKPIDENRTKTEWQPGVQTITVDMPNDVVRINLPDDLRATDSLSGTVYVEPKLKQPGNNETRNGDGLTIEFIRTYPDGTSSYYIVPRGRLQSATPGAVIISHIPGRFDNGSGTSGDVLGYAAGTSPGAFKCEIEITDANGNKVKLTPRIQNSDATDPAETKLPNLGQTGRAISIPGKFDGNSTNTQITIDGKPVEILAESPRKCVFRSPLNVTGAVPIEVNEKGNSTKGTYRSVGVKLTAPKTNLMRGEKTTVTVQVTGLAGIRSDVPLQLEKTGTVTMQDGDMQHLRIRPQDVDRSGMFTLTRGLTGVQPGGFNVTATVFDPARRPIIIPLTQGARVNGYDIVMENGKPVLVAGGVIDPLTGKPLDGTHRLEAGCGNPVLSKIPYLSRLFKNGGSRFDKTDCLVFITPRIIVE